MLFMCKTVLKAGGQMASRWCFWVTEKGQCNSQRHRKLEALHHLVLCRHTFSSQEDEVGCLIICCDEFYCVQKLPSATRAQLLKSWFLKSPSRMSVLNTNWFTESKLPGIKQTLNVRPVSVWGIVVGQVKAITLKSKHWSSHFLP